MLLAKAFALILAIGASVAGIFLLFPSTVIRTLIGERFLVEAHLLAPLSLLMIMVSVAVPLLSFHLALRRRFVAFFGIGAVAGIIALCVADHGTVEAIVRNFTIGLSFLLSAFLLYAVSRRYAAS
jgi:hypothetical protein